MTADQPDVSGALAPLPAPTDAYDIAWVPLLDLPWRDDDRDRKDRP